MMMIEICHLNYFALFILPSRVYSHAWPWNSFTAPQLQIADSRWGRRDSGIWCPNAEATAKGLTICLSLKSEHSNQQSHLSSDLWGYLYIYDYMNKYIYVTLYIYQIVFNENKKMHKMGSDEKSRICDYYREILIYYWSDIWIFHYKYPGLNLIWTHITWVPYKIMIMISTCDLWNMFRSSWLFFLMTSRTFLQPVLGTVSRI